MTGREQFFLIVFDRRVGQPSVEELGTDFAAAMDVYRAREHELAGEEHVEVALLGSSSIEALRRTHSSYFGASGGLGSAMVVPSG
jgi:hypothetical protein